MNVLDEIRAENQELANVLKKRAGIRKLVEELYPDRAHFIYELLQNAEDARATAATFELSPDSVSFEHNGRPFDENDVRAIADIGESTKKDDKIGRFGIGFKAVFAYTETPHIWSEIYSFKIANLVLPTVIPERLELGDKTRFEFSFNNPKKPAQVAYEEIKAELEGLAETTLLFLSHLKCISWHIGSESSGCIIREPRSEHHIEILKQGGQGTTPSSHFLRFSAPTEELPDQTVCVAFPLDFLPNVQKFDPSKPIARQLKIIPTTGSVAVYFPAEKETSGLRFHLHAPFVPELSRASIKDTSANEPLFRQLAKLAADSLPDVRDLGLLTGEFLGVLPNPQDNIPSRYEPIRTAITDAMKCKPLTPTHAKAHAPAVHLRQAKASLKELLTEEDLQFLVPWKEAPLQWAIGATQKNSDQDRFLAGLDISTWDIDQFVELLFEKSPESEMTLGRPPWWVKGPDPKFVRWLATKSAEWHQGMYALLHNEVKESRKLEKLRQLLIVRLSDGSYSTGNKCYFPSDGIEHDPAMPRVALGVYTSGKSKAQQEAARKLLEQIGVREVGETEQIEGILKQRYASEDKPPDDETYWRDFRRFVALVEKEPVKATIFNSYFIFKLANGKIGKPAQVYLDSPYQETGLTAYYEALGGDAKRCALAEVYQESTLSTEQLSKFAKTIGAQAKLEIKRKSTDSHRLVNTLREEYQYGVRRTDTGVDEDWMIPDLELLLPKKSEALSRLVWQTMCKADKEVLKARFRPNQQYLTREQPSSLVLLLQETPWVPQSAGDFVRPQDASRALLPKGFPFDEGYEWLKAIRFGENEQQQSEEHKRRQATAKELGFRTDRDLQDAQWFAGLDLEERQQFRDELERKRRRDLPQNEPRNPERRAERVAQKATNAPERISEMRLRSVSIGREEVKTETEQYLRELYTNADGEMICQVCHDRLPFKLDDGNYYFEKVEFLAELQNRHYQNYLALCPNHAAMFQYANGSGEVMIDLFRKMSGNEFEIVLAQESTTIYFTKTHVADLRAVISADQGARAGADAAL